MSSFSPVKYCQSVDELGATVNQLASEKSSVIILADENTSDHCYPLLANACQALSSAEIITVPAGEASKSLEICHGIWQTLIELKADRRAIMINLGGGVVSDLGGFIAGTYKRGISFVNIPTSLMAMADAAIGGKTGIDLENHKNMIGLFNAPEMVLICAEFLHTLPNEELNSGFAEMIKHALLHSTERWNEISAVSDISTEYVSELLDASIRFKTEVVLQDPYEKGVRKILNFGHTIGHALESYFLSVGRPMSHGHAIARGMVAEAWISNQVSGLRDADFDIINTYISNLYPAPSLAESDTGQVLSFMANDKKNSGSDVRFVLLREIGTPIFDQAVDENLVRAAMNKAVSIS